MKRLVFILSMVVAVANIYGQQIPLYSQYHDAPMIYNPAKTGWDGRYNLNFIYRKQFAGFQNGPETRAFTFDMPIMNTKGGIGVYVFNDNTNIFSRTGGYVSYAYHINFKEDNRLSIGLAAGLQNIKISIADAIVIDPTDPLIANGRTRNTFFDANFGVNWFFKGLNVGVSVPQILGTDLHYLQDNGNRGYTTSRHYMATASYDVKLWEKRITIIPMAMFRTTEALNWQLDGGVTIMYKDFVWINSMYRYNYGVTVGAGFKIHDMVKIGYAYDRGLNDLKSYTTGNHEIMLGLTFGRRKQAGIPDSLAAKVNKQDSLMAALQKNVDSLNKVVDTLGKKHDALSKKVDSLSMLADSMGAFNDAGFDPNMPVDSNGNIIKYKDKDGKDSIPPRFDKDGNVINGVPDSALKTPRKKKGSKDGNNLGTDKMTQKQIDDLKKRLEELEKKYGKNLDEIKKVADKSKDALNEMQEERTRVVDEKDLEFKHGVPMGNYFMVVGSFRVEPNSYKLEQELNKDKYKVGVVYDKKRKWYYVYLSQPENREKGLEELYKLREENERFHDAWIHIMSKAVK